MDEHETALRVVRFSRALILEFATEDPRAHEFVPLLEKCAAMVAEEEVGAEAYACALAAIDTEDDSPRALSA